MRPAARRAEAERGREVQLGELRKLTSFHKLKEAMKESAHERRIEAVRNGATTAIAGAVEGGAAARRRSGKDEPAADVQGGPLAFGLLSVAEVQEAEQALSEQLRSTRAHNAQMLDKLAAIKKVIEGSEQKHDHHMRGKVRYLLKKHTRLEAQE